MKHDSEIFIPDDAIQLLDEVIGKCELVIDANRPVEVQFEEYQIIESDVTNATERLFELLNLLGNKWCYIDPLCFDFCTHRKGDDFHFLFYNTKAQLSPADNLERRYLPDWWKTGDIPSEVIWKRVPAELGIVLYQYEHDTLPNKLPSFTIESLVSLKTKVLITLRAKSATLPTSDFNTGPKEDTNSFKPSLTSSGRVIRCKTGEYTFTKSQSPVIRILWKNYEAGNEFMPEQDILEEARLPESSFGSLFKSIKKKKEWSIFEHHQTQKDLWRLRFEQTIDLEET